MILSKKRGFTLIELLVVIAIIGILSSVVLASLNTARGKGANAAVKQNLNSIRGQAELVYDNNSGFYSVGLNSVCSDQNVINALNAALAAGSDTGTVATRCNASANAWAVNALLKDPEGANTYWCIDNSGVGKGEPAELAGALACS